MQIEINVPEDHVVNAQVTVIQTLGPNGKIGYMVSQDGSAALSTCLGLLELAKDALIEQFNRERGEESDED